MAEAIGVPGGKAGGVEDRVLEYLSRLGEGERTALFERARAEAAAPRGATVEPPAPAEPRCGACLGGNGPAGNGECGCAVPGAAGAGSTPAAQGPCPAGVLGCSAGGALESGAADEAGSPEASLALSRALAAEDYARARGVCGRVDFEQLDESGWSCLHWAVHMAGSARASPVADECAEGCCAPGRASPASRALLREVLGHPRCRRAVDVRNADGATPLMFAADAGDREACEWLVDAGADATLEDSSGETAAAWASGQRHVQLAQWLSNLRAAAAA